MTTGEWDVPCTRSVVSDMTVRRFLSRAGPSKWPSATIVLLLVAATSARRGEGELCHSKNGGSGKCLHISLCPSAIHRVYKGIELDICGFQGSAAIVCCEDPAASSQVIAGGQPARKPETPPNGLPESPTKQPNRRFGSEFQPPTTQFGNTSSQKTRRSISEEKCDEYSRSVQDIFEALPLLPDADPLIIKVDKCDFENLPLIVGGEDTDVGEFPHMAAIGYQVDGNLEWNCGGSLISEYYVLTAAHCTHIGKYPAVIVRLGEMNLKRDDDGAHPVDYHIADLVRHPEYKGPSKYNDIALLRLSKRVDFNKFIRPACLYTHDKFSVSKTVATGWGKIEYAGKSSDTLRKVVLDIIDNKMCNNLWKSLGKLTSLPRGIAPSMMCAGVLTGGKDTCQGDSGGPIQISTKGNQCVYHVIGVTSFGNYCAGEDSPGIYTRVSSFIPWIESIVWPDG